MYLLTYHGDEAITHLFSTKEKAINYAVAQVRDCTDIDGEVKVATDNVTIAEWANENVVEAVIFDTNDEDDIASGLCNIYTVERVELDPTYEPRWS